MLHFGENRESEKRNKEVLCFSHLFIYLFRLICSEKAMFSYDLEMSMLDVSRALLQEGVPF